MLNNIPTTWLQKYLSDSSVAQVIMGQSPDSSSYNEEKEGLPFYQGKTDFGKVSPTPRVWCSKPVKIAEANDILLSVRAPVGAVNICTEKSCIGRGLCAIRTKEIVLPKFLYYFFVFYEPILKTQGSGAVFDAITKAFVDKITVPIPPTLAEQQEIVQVLDTMSDIIRLREECISHAQDLIPALFQEMFKNYENDTISLSNICDIKGGKRLPQGEKLIDEKTNHPYIRVTNFKNQSIDMSDIKYITEEVYQKISRYVITTNDIYISIAGTIGLVGDIPNELNNANLTENAAKLIINKKEVNKKYLIYCLNSPYLQQQIKEATVGVGVPKLALARIGALKVYLPPIKLQEQFAQKAIEIESYIKEQEEERDNAKQMFQSLLHHAFTGELTNNKPQGDTLEK